MKKLLYFLMLFSNLFAKEIFLNKKEINYLNHLRSPIKIAITEIPNQILVTKNGYTGYCIDLFKIIENELNTKFQYVYFKTWNMVINAAKKGEIDIVFAAQKTPSRLKYLDFTDTILIQQNKILTNLSSQNYKSLSELTGKSVAVTKGSAIEEYLQINYPEIKIIPTTNEVEALKLVNQNMADAAISESVRAGYYIKKYNLNNLTVSGDLGYNYYLRIASIRKKPILNVILSKAVDNIPEKKIKALQLKWGYIIEKVKFIDKEILTYIAIAFCIIIPFSFYLYFINLKLKKEIEEKESALKRITMLTNSKLNHMSEILSMIAHQWKQPLNNLSLLIQVLIKKFNNGTIESNYIKKFELQAMNQISYMSETIDDFKNLFNIEDKKRTFDLNKLINEIISDLNSDYENINVVFNNKNKIILNSYPNLLKQILINILNNAKDALLEKNINNKKIIITTAINNNKVLIQVEDNAGGVPLDIIDKIFDPYFSTKKNKNGTGLGLYMVKILLKEKINGEIEVRNTDKGAKFEITIL